MTRAPLGLSGTLAVLLSLAPRAAAGPVVEVRVEPSATSSPVSGRLLVFAHRTAPRPADAARRDPECRLFAVDVRDLAPGKTRRFGTADLAAWPESLDGLGAGTWRFQAVLDTAGTFNYDGLVAGDLEGPPVEVPGFDATGSPVVALTLARTVPSEPARESARTSVFTVESRKLSDFWKKPVRLRAAIARPPGAAAGLPTVYVIGGFGADLASARRGAESAAAAMDAGDAPPLNVVVLDPSFFSGHHVFADSANNGPWGEALTTEFVPAVEAHLGAAAVRAGRFVTGHSSGGWSSLWLQVRYPEVFGGVWSTSPDPVDFRFFTGTDLTKENANVYRGADGTPTVLVRRQGRPAGTFEDFARREAVLGPVGGQMAAFDWVFSPKGEGGRPRPLFDRRTGNVDPEVARAWEPYDIRLKLEREWTRLAPLLDGKLTIVVGDEDTFRLEESTKSLFEFLRPRIHGGFDARLELHYARDHSDLYGKRRALLLRFFAEMDRAWKASSRAPAGATIRKAA